MTTRDSIALLAAKSLVYSSVIASAENGYITGIGQLDKGTSLTVAQTSASLLYSLDVQANKFTN
jgi:hypothetical protein